MKVVFVSNFMNHHQKELCDYIYEHTDEFRFVCMTEIPKTTLAFGYEDLSRLPYVVFRSVLADSALKRLILDADIAIMGDSSNDFLSIRSGQEKLTYLVSERLWKMGYYRRWIPTTRRKVDVHFDSRSNRNLYVLASSCYLAGDLQLIGFPTERCFQWGYFPPLETIDDPEALYDYKQKNSMIWAGRLIPLKHLEATLEAVFVLCREGYQVSLTIIGDGPEKEKVMRLIRQYGIEANVKFCGSMPSALVREEMKKAQILLANSDFNEGWGAVVNEGMNSCCAPVISHAMGSSAFLIRQGENGFVYESGNVKDLTEKIRLLLDDPERCKTMGINAYKTILREYNGEIAGERLLAVSNKLLNGASDYFYKSGLMSRSVVLKNDWIGRC